MQKDPNLANDNRLRHDYLFINMKIEEMKLYLNKIENEDVFIYFWKFIINFALNLKKISLQKYKLAKQASSYQHAKNDFDEFLNECRSRSRRKSILFF